MKTTNNTEFQLAIIIEAWRAQERVLRHQGDALSHKQKAEIWGVLTALEEHTRIVQVTDNPRYATTVLKYARQGWAYGGETCIPDGDTTAIVLVREPVSPRILGLVWQTHERAHCSL